MAERLPRGALDATCEAEHQYWCLSSKENQHTWRDHSGSATVAHDIARRLRDAGLVIAKGANHAE